MEGNQSSIILINIKGGHLLSFVFIKLVIFQTLDWCPRSLTPFSIKGTNELVSRDLSVLKFDAPRSEYSWNINYNLDHTKRNCSSDEYCNHNDLSDDLESNYFIEEGILNTCSTTSLTIWPGAQRVWKSWRACRDSLFGAKFAIRILGSDSAELNKIRCSSSGRMEFYFFMPLKRVRMK